MNSAEFPSERSTQPDRALRIRPAEPSDAALIADISRQTFFDTFSSQNTPENMRKFMETQFAREKLMQELNDPENLFFLAYQDEELAGYLKLRDHSHEKLKNIPALEIVRIYSVSSMIGKGIGKALMQKSIEEASTKKKFAIWLGVWEKNQRAIDFYKRWGFEKFAEHNFILGDDIQTDWLLKKDLTYNNPI